MSPVRVQLPYCSWDAVRSFLEHLAKGTFPGKIDGSVFPPELNPATIEQVSQSLRRLALVGKGGTPTDGLRRLLVNGPEGWREVLKDHYREFFKSGWETMTSKQFISLLEAHGAKGETALRAGRFVLQALRYCDIRYSSLLDDFAKTGKRAKPPGRDTSSHRDVASPHSGRPGNSTYKFKLDFGQFRIELGEDPTDRDLELLQGIIELERQWKRRGPGRIAATSRT
jgi:hypothetical protein